jgi:hypothetical protein
MPPAPMRATVGHKTDAAGRAPQLETVIAFA